MKKIFYRFSVIFFLAYEPQIVPVNFISKPDSNASSKFY